ncbi:hypothetical protein [Prescottella subtropica]|uniref:hypothetical protein n=1 Tax=Prescottella subtropica TaxID=2545757 RepID=UPI0010F6A8A1|nr:hypothetical protein [Prescottella subtropica]
MTPDRSDPPWFPLDAQRVVERWDPDGLQRWRDRTSGGRAVHVVAVPGIDAGPVLSALAGQDPVTDARDGGAAVVVPVLDGASVLGRDELAALDEAAAGVEHVLFVLTDVGEPGRDAVHRRDEELLRAHHTRYADARILTDVDALTAAVSDALAADPATTADRGDRRAVSVLLTRTCRRIGQVADALRAGNDTGTVELRARRARLVAARDGGRVERSAELRAEVQRARMDLLHEAGARVRAVAATARAEIDRAGRVELRDYPVRMAELSRAAVADVDAVVSPRLADLAVRAGTSDLPPAAAPPIELGFAGPEPRHRGVEDRVMVVVGASAGVGLGRLAVTPIAMVPALDIATIPVTLALGGAAAWGIARSRRLAADRAHVRQWAAEATAHLRAQLEQRVLGRILETEAAVGARILADGRAAGLTADEELAAVDAELRRLAAQRTGRIGSCERDRAALAAVLASLGDRTEPDAAAVRPTP